MTFQTKEFNNSIVCAVTLEKEYLYFTEIFDEDNICKSIEGIIEVDLESFKVEILKDIFKLEELDLPVSNEYLVTHSYLSNNILLIVLTKII